MAIIPEKLGSNPLHRMRNRIAAELLEEQWTVNYKVNKKYLDRAVPFSSLTNMNDSAIAIIVGAGPSLKENLNGLVHFPHKEDLVFFCTDKAFPKMLAQPYNIDPDYVCVLNAKSPDIPEGKEVVHWLGNAKGSSTKLIMPITADPHTLQGWHNPYCFVSCGLPIDLTDTIQQETGLNPIPGGTNVGVFSYLMATRLGFRKIVLIGMDYSFEKREDCFSDFHGGQKYAPGEPYIILEHRDRLGRIRWSTWDWFDSAISMFEYARFFRNHGVRTVNCTEGGIIYDGEYIEDMTMKEAGDALWP